MKVLIAGMFLYCLSVACAPNRAAWSSQQEAPIKIPPAPADPAASTAKSQAPGCPYLGNWYVPVEGTILAKVPVILDSAHLKPGKKIWLNSLVEDNDPECKIVKDAVIYGSVTAASSSRKAAASELGLEFDRADCFRQTAKSMKLTVIAVVSPESWPSDTVHNALPGHGGGVSSPYGWDQSLDPGGPPNFVYPGEVVGLKKLNLDPQSGPRCSAKLTSQDGKIELLPGTVLVLAVSN